MVTVIAIIIFFLIFFYVVLNIVFIPYYTRNNLSIFNPIRNYNVWTQFNWFGIAILTILLNIIFLPYAIVYWIYKLFTVGRKEKL